MSQKNNILEYIKNNTTLDILSSNIKDSINIGVSAYNIEDEFNIVRNNSSTILNKLHKEGLLIKIISRPVTFIFKNNLNKEVICKDSYKLEEIKHIILNMTSQHSFIERKSLDNIIVNDNKKTDELFIKNSNINNNSHINDNDPFKKLVGHSSSLLSQITKAKAAILYPPKGLNTLILGESGVGKTTFANAMYQFSKSHKKANKDIPFISFNCADYYNNPQLLLSQLFGHVKGAFTGASSDKEGLVEKADNGILFLDEIHRLPADGQEMLFYLMDNGKFNRLGETSKNRTSNVLIIAATTENPDDVLLTTFLRRIPVTLKLPSFSERSIEERIELIKNLFIQESSNLSSTIKIDSIVLKALWLYDYPKGNLGQLYSEVKLLCAKGFLDSMKENSSSIHISFNMLNREISSHYENMDNISKNFYNLSVEYIEFDSRKNDYTTSLKISNSLDNNIYNKISSELTNLKELGLSDNDIDERISDMIYKHYKSVSNNFNANNLNFEYLDKVINHDIVIFSTSLLNYASVELQVVFSDKFALLLAMHIQSLVNRLLNGEGVKRLNLSKLKKKHPKEYEVASYFLIKISEKFNLVIPEYEKGFLTILLANNQESYNTSDIGILVMCHGNTTASSMCEVANTILDSNIVKAINMPLSATVKDIYNITLKKIKSMRAKKGVLLLVDMGSLVSIGNEIAKNTNINIKTISNVSTLTVLEALRQVLFKNYSIDEIHNNLLNTFNKTTVNNVKPNAIITLCATGKGSSVIAKNMVIEVLSSEQSLSSINVISVQYENHESYIEKLEEKYNILACIGNMRPKVHLNYFPINQLFVKGFDVQFKNFLLDMINPILSKESSSDIENVYTRINNTLSKYVKFVNPIIAVNCIKKFINDIGYSNSEEDELFDLALHLGCMLDRCIKGYNAIFENKDKFICSYHNQFSIIKNSIKIIEDEFLVKIPDDELCFLIQILNRDKN